LDQAPKREKQETNFGGQDSELWCEGGELTFIQNMMRESVKFAKQVGWFSTLVSRAESLPTFQKTLKQIGVPQYQVLDMSQGQKKSRILAWKFAR
jgi:23S rRNA (adenine1618-N6)-methyltransferase